MRKRTIISITATLALLILIGWKIYSRRVSDMSTRRGGAVAVKTEPIRRGEITDIRVFTGTLMSRSRYVVAPKVAGRLEQLAVDIGEPLTSGRLMARIDDEEYVQQVAQAQAIVDVARAGVEQQETAFQLAQREMERVRRLREKKIAAEAEWDKAESEYQTRIAQHRVALAQLAEKESLLKAAEVRLAYTRINAPANIMTNRWFVEERYVDAGAMLAANTPIIAVVDLLDITAIINVIESDYPLIHIGMPALIETDAYPDNIFTGMVARIAPALQASTRQARVEFSVNNDRRLLRPGMFIRARIEFARHTNAMLIPRAALTRNVEVAGVFLIDPEKLQANFVPVKTGIKTPEIIEILSPQLEGRVATLGRHLLSDGSPVVIVDESNRGRAEKSGEQNQ